MRRNFVVEREGGWRQKHVEREIGNRIENACEH